MKVVLVLPGNDNYRSSAISQAGAEHLGLGYIAAYARQHGHDVITLNFQVNAYLSYWEGLEQQQTSSVENAIIEILQYDPQVVGISVTGITLTEALGISYGLKKARSNLHISWGGHQAFQSAKDILQRESAVDTIVAGDGEITFTRLLESIGNNGNIGDISGLWYRREEKIIFSGTPPEPNLDELPFPDRDTLQELQQRGAKVTDARISTSRGCPFKCSFCVDPSLGYRKKWRARSAKKVVEEITNLVKHYGISFFWFSEDNFIPPTRVGHRRANEIARLLIERKLDIGYRALLRADAIDGQRDLLKNLVQSGLSCVYMGIESGSPRRLAYFRKHETPELYQRVVKLLREFKIGLQVGFIMFDPLTHWEDLELDAKFLYEIKEMYLYSNFCQVLDVFPGTELSQILIQKGLLDKNFTYDSPFDEYDYEIPALGTMAHAMQSAYKENFVEIDKFFQRLRVVDLPRLWRQSARQKVIGLETLEDLFSSILKKLNQSGLDFFIEVLELAQSGWDDNRFKKCLDIYHHEVANQQETFLKEARNLPANIRGDLSAAQGLF